LYFVPDPTKPRKQLQWIDTMQPQGGGSNWRCNVQFDSGQHYAACVQYTVKPNGRRLIMHGAANPAT
jgi:hypothetical protein